MRFVCIRCDRPLTRTSPETDASEHGRVRVTFECGSCGAALGLLANEQDRWLLEPDEAVASGHVAEPDVDRELPRPPIAQPAGATAEETTSWSPSQEGGDGPPSLGVASSEARALDAAAAPLRWTPEAERRLLAITGSVQHLSRDGIEAVARRRGDAEVTTGTIEAALGDDD